MTKRRLVFFLGAAGLTFAILLLFFVKLKAEDNIMKTDEVNKKGTVRPAAVAGQFYPAGEDQVEEKLADWLSGQAADVDPDILLVPHAGWKFSGATAGEAFSLIKEADYRRVILLGSAHKQPTDKAVLAESDFWRTPLGQVAVDQAAVEQLAASSDKIIKNASAHRADHVLEVELPFLQAVLDNFKIVPILLGRGGEPMRQAVTEGLLSLLQEEKTLLVISSDLSHYPTQSVAERVDEQTMTAILSGQEEEFVTKLAELEKGYPPVATFACGADAIRVVLRLGEELGWRKQEQLAITNSGAVTGQSDRVVGYGAAAFWLEGKGEFGPKEQDILLNWSRQALEVFIKAGKELEKEPPEEVFEEKRGVFVTLEKNGRLRGCIGNFLPKSSVWEQVRQMTIAAASQDHRFPPVKEEELEDITIEISLLSPLEEIEDWQDFQLGKHGIYLKRANQSGTFLPQVAEEGDWTKESFLAEICRQKMGLESDCYKKPAVTIYRYTVEKFLEG